MSPLVPALIAALALAVTTAALILLAVVVAGIHAAERRKSLCTAPRTRREALARRVLGVPTRTRRPANSRR